MGVFHSHGATDRLGQHLRRRSANICLATLDFQSKTIICDRCAFTFAFLQGELPFANDLKETGYRQIDLNPYHAIVSHFYIPGVVDRNHIICADQSAARHVCCGFIVDIVLCLFIILYLSLGVLAAQLL
jgi:hypothetical protein